MSAIDSRAAFVGGDGTELEADEGDDGSDGGRRGSRNVMEVEDVLNNVTFHAASWHFLFQVPQAAKSGGGRMPWCR